MVSYVTRPLLSTLLAVGLCLGAGSAAPRGEPNDLDAFMRQVLASRDANWKKLQQYVLDERELIELHGPGRTLLWGERREYTWFIREGFFVRSPIKFNGVEIADSERRKFEADYLHRVQERDKRRARRLAEAAGEPTPAPGPNDGADGVLARDVDALIRQTREPEFISSAYFLRFKFEEGKYALAGREALDGREVLRIEYYPTKLFSGTDRRRTDQGPSDADKARDAQFQRLMNKVALVTLWVEPTAHQIVKYTFDNVGFDFLPGRWLAQINDLKATMTMGQPFPEVWLPNALEFVMSGTLAVGQFDLRYRLDYHDYRQPEVTTKVGVKER
jgi:hypothetical protein